MKVTKKREIPKQIQKYVIELEDWKNIPLVNSKMNAQSVISLFAVLNNILAHCISPKEANLIDDTEKKILEYLNKNFIDK